MQYLCEEKTMHGDIESGTGGSKHINRAMSQIIGRYCGGMIGYAIIW